MDKIKKSCFYIFTLCVFLCLGHTQRNTDELIRIVLKGKQPALAVDTKGGISIVYGDESRLYYITGTHSKDMFSPPAEVAHLKGLSLGMSRGPQIAVTKDFTVIAATNEAGNIYAYRLQHSTKQWNAAVQINDVDTLAKEGFVALASGADNTVYAVWLDLRSEKQNKIYGSVSTDGGKIWSANKLIYESPEGKGSVCECCKPSVTAKGNHVYVMFRNSLAGARDLYMITSIDGGATFGKAQKLGSGTWPLKACPMDGGDISIDAQGNIVTVWRRKNEIFMAEPGQAEHLLGEGKTATIAKTVHGNFIAWYTNGNIMAMKPHQQQAFVLGKGTYPAMEVLPDNKSAFCVWENENGIVAKRISY